MLSFFSESGGYFSIVTSVLMGAAFFMLFGIVTYAMQRGKRDFTSTSQVVATNYDVVVAFEAAHEARRLLHQLPMTQHDASVPAYQQHDHQHQPFQPGQQQPGPQQPGQPGHGQQGHGQPGQGQTPQRPAGWSDPYGQRTADAGRPARRRCGRPRQEPEPARPSGVSYPDLPDGRPQYGVRVDGRSPGRENRARSSGRRTGPGTAQPGRTPPGGRAAPSGASAKTEGGRRITGGLPLAMYFEPATAAGLRLPGRCPPSRTRRRRPCAAARRSG